MNTKTIFGANFLRTAMVIVSVLLALPAMAQQNDMQGMDMSSMQGMQMTSPPQAQQPLGMQQEAASMPGMQQKPMRPSPIAGMQHLHFGNMIGTRPKPGGLAGGMQAMSSTQGMDMSSMQGMDMSSMQGMDMSSMQGMDMSSMQGMDMSSMQDMEMSSMQGGSAPPDARSPDYSDGYTYGPMRGMDMADDDSHGMVMLDQLEYAHDNHGGNAQFIDSEAWYGKDFNKLWLKAEGERSGGKLQDLRTEVLWDHAYDAYFSTQLGVRHDFGEGPSRNWAVFGVQGLAPYWFENEAFVYLGDNGRTAARFQVEYEELLTQRLILQPKVEINLYGRDDPQRGIGSELSDAEFGLRLRYEIRREFAPYIGIVWRQRYGRTADFARAQGEHAELQLVAGLHVWF